MGSFQATVTIPLRRSRTVAALLALLKAHFKASVSSGPAAQVLIWLDIFAINQHPYTDGGALLNDDVANLAKVVAATERTLFCLDSRCTVLSRIWCLFEVRCGSLNNNQHLHDNHRLNSRCTVLTHICCLFEVRCGRFWLHFAQQLPNLSYVTCGTVSAHPVKVVAAAGDLPMALLATP